MGVGLEMDTNSDRNAALAFEWGVAENMNRAEVRNHDIGR